MTHWRRDGAKT